MKPDELSKSMLDQYGPLMSGEQLWRALGYKTWAAFARAARAGTLGVQVFVVPGRRGKFALTTEVAAWLTKLGGKASID